jgi:hypothetical protein
VIALGSEMGDLQTIFYAVLAVGVLLGIALMLIGIGATSLGGLLRRPGHRLLGLLIATALLSSFVFVLGGTASVLLVVLRRG